MKKSIFVISIILIALLIECQQTFIEPEWKTWSSTPPMGWNSYGCYGGDPLSSNEKSKSFLVNKEVLAVNQNSTNNHQVYHSEYTYENDRLWMADIPGRKTNISPCST